MTAKPANKPPGPKGPGGPPGAVAGLPDGFGLASGEPLPVWVWDENGAHIETFLTIDLEEVVGRIRSLARSRSTLDEEGGEVVDLLALERKLCRLLGLGRGAAHRAKETGDLCVQFKDGVVQVRVHRSLWGGR